MKTRFKLNYDYIDQADDPRLSEAATEEMLRCIQPDAEKYTHVCDDFELCEELLKDDKLFFVELDNITVFNTAVCVMGLQAQYRCEYEDSKIILKEGKMHYFSRGCFSFVAGSSAHRETVTLKVTRKESIIKVRPEKSGVKGKPIEMCNRLPTQSLSI